MSHMSGVGVLLLIGQISPFCLEGVCSSRAVVAWCPL